MPSARLFLRVGVDARMPPSLPPARACSRVCTQAARRGERGSAVAAAAGPAGAGEQRFEPHLLQRGSPLLRGPVYKQV